MSRKIDDDYERNLATYTHLATKEITEKGEQAFKDTVWKNWGHPITGAEFKKLFMSKK